MIAPSLKLTFSHSQSLLERSMSIVITDRLDLQKQKLERKFYILTQISPNSFLSVASLEKLA